MSIIPAGYITYFYNSSQTDMDTSFDFDHVIAAIESRYCKLQPDCIAALPMHFRPMQVSKETKLVKEGQYADKTYYIVKGCVRAYYVKDGKEITDWFAFENEFVCSIHSFFNNVPSPHYIEVLEDSLLLEISRDSAQQLSEAFHNFETLQKQVVVHTLLKLQYRVEGLLFESAHNRYQNLLAYQPDITLRVPLTHIASHLGITLETLSRIRNPKYGI
ncbi:MAG: Crp/Fnr family transcriptional regulator [Flavipsychrobacter sp.]